MMLAAAAELAILLTSIDPAARPTQPDLGKLSAKERELVVLVAQGRTDAEIAEQPQVSVRTVGSRVNRVRDKAGWRRRADLVRLALQAGLL
jgi:DNA-binding NarL/FixJ family response regulator